LEIEDNLEKIEKEEEWREIEVEAIALNVKEGMAFFKKKERKNE